MLRAPSCRKRQSQDQRPNLIPILDAVFIFIFFLLMSANFIKIYEIASDVPLVSSEPPPPQKKKPLALTLRIDRSRIVLLSGVPSRTMKTFPKKPDGIYDLEKLHTYLVNNVKKRFPTERSIILEPKINLKYEEIIKVMDSVRKLRRTDRAFYSKKGKGPNAFEERHFDLFDKIVFGNIQNAVN